MRLNYYQGETTVHNIICKNISPVGPDKLICLSTVKSELH